VVAGYCQNAETPDQLSRIFMNSPEFMCGLGSAQEKPPVNLGATEPYWPIVTQTQKYMAEFDQKRE